MTSCASTRVVAVAIAGYLLGTLTGNTLVGWILAVVAGATMYAWSRRAARRGATCALPGASQRRCRPEAIADDQHDGGSRKTSEAINRSAPAGSTTPRH